MSIKERREVAREYHDHAFETARYRANPMGLKPGFVPRTHCPECKADLSRPENRLNIPGQVARCRTCHNNKAAKSARQFSSGAMSSTAKLRGEQVAEIRRSTEPGTVLAKKFGVKPNAIYLIRNGRTWR